MIICDLAGPLRVALLERFVGGLLVEARLKLLRRRSRGLRERIGGPVSRECHIYLWTRRQPHLRQLLSHKARFRRQILIDER